MNEQADNAVYSALMALKPADLSLNQWAVAAGTSRSIFTEIRRHGNPTSGTLAKLLDAINVPRGEFDRRTGTVLTEVAGSGIDPSDLNRRLTLERAKHVPLVGSAMGGEWDGIEEAVELTELHLSDVLDHLARPPSLATDPDAYAVSIVGDSMAPRFEPGERAYVSVRAPLSIGDDVIVQLKRGEGEDDEAERVALVLIKRLKRRSAGFVELEQFNPATTFRVETRKIAAIHRVVGRL